MRYILRTSINKKYVQTCIFPFYANNFLAKSMLPWDIIVAKSKAANHKITQNAALFCDSTSINKE